MTSTPQSSRFAGILNKLRSPSFDLLPKIQTPNQNVRNSFSSGNSSKGIVVLSPMLGEYMDFMEDDVPLPVFECDFMNAPSSSSTPPSRIPASTTISTVSITSLAVASTSRSNAVDDSPPMLHARVSARSTAAINSTYSNGSSGSSQSSGDGPKRPVLGLRGKASEKTETAGAAVLRTLGKSWSKSKDLVSSPDGSTSKPPKPLPAIQSSSDDQYSPPLLSNSTRAPASRYPANDRTLSSSQPASYAHADAVTPAFPRAISVTKRWKPTQPSTGKPLRKAGRIAKLPDADIGSTTEDGEGEGDNEGAGQSPDALETSMTAPSPNSPNRSNSAANLSSNREESNEGSNGAVTATISASAYLNRNRRAPIELQSKTERQSSLLDHTLVDTRSGDLTSKPIVPVPARSRYPLKPTNGLSSSQPPSSSSRPLASTSSEVDMETLLRSTPIDTTPPRPDLLRKESVEIRRSQKFKETSARLIAAEPNRPPTIDERRTVSAMGSYPVSSHSPPNRISPELRSADREPLGRSVSSASHYPDRGSEGPSSMDRATTVSRQSKPSTSRQPLASIPVDAARYDYTPRNQAHSLSQSQPPSQSTSRSSSRTDMQEPLRDENYYDPRHGPAPTHSAHPPQQFYPPPSRPPLGETYRATNNNTFQQPSPPLSHSQSRATDYQTKTGRNATDSQAPLRDRSPGMGEMTPNYGGQYYQTQNSQQQYQQYQQQGPPIAKEKIRKKYSDYVVNGVRYARIGLAGKGGSSKVWKVLDPDNTILALKRVDIQSHDYETRASFANEIELLEKLRGNSKIIKLIASEINEKSLMMVMELGDVDLNVILCDSLSKPINLNFIRYIWQQMLEAVAVVHEVNIVHTDLKPANFVLVKGILKLIDFGISKAIGNDTTNIARDQQIGTANYMSPEALLDSGLGFGGKRLMKLGRPSDVWSLGIILYQMVYSHTPYSIHRDINLKIAAIQNPTYSVKYPDLAVPVDSKGKPILELSVSVGRELKNAMMACLRFDSKARDTIPELLRGEFLMGRTAPPVSKKPTLAVDEAMLSIMTQRIAVMLMGKSLSSADAAMLSSKLFAEGIEAQAD